MKTTLKIAFISSILFLASCTQPQEGSQQKSTAETSQTHNDVTNYIVLTSNIQQIRSISQGAQMLKAENPDAYGKTEVVVCGKTVSEITRTEVMAPILKTISEGNLDVKICGFSINEHNVDVGLIPEPLTIVENGIWYNFKKQAEGFRSLGL